jgi:hypothetical protein
VTFGDAQTEEKSRNSRAQGIGRIGCAVFTVLKYSLKGVFWFRCSVLVPRLELWNEKLVKSTKCTHSISGN